MRLAVIGATGRVGSRVVEEALQRGHDVTAVVRRPDAALPEAVAVRVADASRTEQVAEAISDQDVVVLATRSSTGSVEDTVQVMRAVLAAVRARGLRLLVVGGAATLRTPTGQLVIEDARYLPPRFRDVARASEAQLDVCRSEGQAAWAYLSPPAELLAGERTGRFRLGGDDLVVDGEGRSYISMEDLAVVIVNEAERPTVLRRRFTAGY